jgi:hypothetical protein
MAEIDIRPGDVLLFHGDSLVSKAIRLFDGTDVNHAAVSVEGGQLVEAAGDGVRRADVRATVKDNVRTYVRRLKQTDDLAPVVARANAYADAGVHYAYQQIVLLGVLTLTRRAPAGNPVVRLAMRKILDEAAKVLNSIAERGGETMICSELVYRAYDEAVAGRDDPYRLDVPVFTMLDGRNRLALPGLAPADAGAVTRAQPGSLLHTWLSSAPPAVPVPARPRPAEPLAAGPPEELAAEAEKRLEPALRELMAAYDGTAEDGDHAHAEDGDRTHAEDGDRARAAAAPEEAGTDEAGQAELAAAAATFAAALAREAAGPAAPGTRDLSTVLTAVADFVTPGDLLRCPSLFDLGTVPGR